MNDWLNGEAKLQADRWTPQIEDYLRTVWGADVYEQSAFAALTRSERERESRLRARPKKGK